MDDRPIRSTLKLPDDVFRARLAETIAALEAWALDTRDAATIELEQGPSYWKLRSEPTMANACGFEIVFDAGQLFSLRIDREIYEERPFDRFDFFPMMARAIAAGNVERIETRSALTDALEKIESRILLEDGWAWVGERRAGPRLRTKLKTAEERHVHRFLPYRR